jgi:Na+/H+ antiporter NhaD/arsenite permease-like protein
VLILFSLVTALSSAFLDNVTTVLLLTPMLLTIAKLMKLNPLPYLIAEIFASNVGGAATLIGDPPNIMIASAAGLTFNEFLMVMAPIALIDLGIVLLMMFLIYGRSMKVEPHERDVMMKAMENLDENAAIQDRSLFKKSIVTILLVVVMFFFHSLLGLEPAEVALIGAAIILFWSREPPELILEKIEWPALFFFGGLFIVVGALVQTGVISQIASAMVGLVSTTGEAMILVVWFSAVASAIVDNIPLTAAMIPLIKDLGTTMEIYPLWWALSVGACLGGNGTAIGASANVVVLGISEREGINISFLDFMKLGMAVMVITVAVGLGMLWVMFIL